jgi:AsmA-like C-terminal region
MLILALVVALIYVNRVGLPDFAKRPLLEKLRARGLDLEISHLRVSFHRGLVGENVRFGSAESVVSPQLSAKDIEVKINYLALLKKRLQVTGVILDRGRFAWPVADTDAPERELVVKNIRANLRLLPGDEWALDHFHATFAGADFTVSGNVTNASAIRDWPFLRAKHPAATAQQRVRRLADLLERIHFAMQPKLHLMVNGDARNLQSFTLRCTLGAPDADTPWGKITNAVLTVRLSPAAGREPMHAELSLQADDAQTPWAKVSGLDLAAHLVPLTDKTNLVKGVLNAEANSVETKWASVTNAQFSANWIHSLTNAIPLSGLGDLHCFSVATPWISGREFRLTATLATRTNPPPSNASWAWWANLQPFRLDWKCELAQPDTQKLAAKKVLCAGWWRAPELTITNLRANFPDGALDGHAQLDVATRKARFDLTSNFDVKKIAPLLSEYSRRWLDKFSWTTPPNLAGGGAVTLPAWTNRHPDWRAEVQPSLRLAGEVFVTNGAYLGLPVDWVHTHFTYSNLVWHLPDLAVGRPEGKLHLVHIANEATKDYYWRIHSTIDVRALRPQLAPKEQRGFDLISFTQPPVIDGEVWGRSHEPDRIRFQGHVAMTNFSVRGQSATSFESMLHYTNRILKFADPHLLRGTQTLVASGITVDFNTQRIYFTNGFSTAEPLVVAEAIGPHILRAIEAYRFTQPPTVRVNGYAPLHGSSDADLNFDVAGGPFEWWKFNVPHIAGQVHWLGETLNLTNVRVAFYDGDAAGSAHFDFTSEPGTDLKFTVGVTNANLSSLLADVSTRTNHLEGVLGGRLVITHANTEDAHSWTGYGNARLRNGYLWEIPIFGVLSKPLDALMPGVGSSRFSDASGKFVVTNSIIDWERLEMRAPTMRLQYAGTVDFDNRVNMRVEAEPLRDAPVFGAIFSLALWPVSKLFQFHITGTLDKPESEPVYVPKVLFAPLHPFRTLEDLFAPDTVKSNTPPVYKDLQKQ